MDRLRAWWSARRTRTKAIIVGLVALLLVGFGASLGAEPQPETAVVPSPSATIAATAAPTTAAPTPSETATATPEPSIEPPSPSPEPSMTLAQINAVTFQVHAATTAATIGQSMTSIQDALEDEEVEVAAERSREARSAIQDELEWLDDNPPHECYAEMHEAYRQGLESYDDGLAAAVRFFDLFPFGDMDDVAEFQTKMTEGSSSFSETTEMMNDFTEDQCPL